MEESIYCIISEEEWAEAKTRGAFEPESLESEGFIHCSYPRQLIRVANKHFFNRKKLIIACIHRSKLPCKVVDEDLYQLNDLYPHIYGPLLIEAVYDVVPFSCKADGTFDLPDKLQPS